jgi:SAM-dependent methyltransferase
MKEHTDETVKDHFERWPFPGTGFLSREGLLLLKYLHRWLRPEGKARQNKEGSAFIDVGCGTGDTVIALAGHFPEVRFLGVDVSGPSLEAARKQAKDSGHSNVTFRQFDIANDPAGPDRFDVVMCLGVLHHIRDMARAFGRVAALVKPGGHAVLWFYGRRGRQKHRLNQRFLELLNTGKSPHQALDTAQEFLRDMGEDFAEDTGFYTPKGAGKEGVEYLLEHPQWLADQMIPAIEHDVTMEDILRLFSVHRLEFSNWLGVPLHLTHYTSSPLLLECFENLSFENRLLAMDYLIKPGYYFVAGKKQEENGHNTEIK